MQFQIVPLLANLTKKHVPQEIKNLPLFLSQHKKKETNFRQFILPKHAGDYLADHFWQHCFASSGGTLDLNLHIQQQRGF